MLFIGFSACTDIEKLNKNVKDPDTVPGELLFTNAQKALFDQMVSTNVNYNVFRLFVQHWTETTYTDESNYDLLTRTIPDQHWDVLYRDVLKDFNEASRIITETVPLSTENPSIKKNKLAIIEIMTVYTFSILVETFGDVPYSEALDLDKPLPKYDDALTIYKDLIVRLDAAIGNLDAGAASFDEADNMYEGDVAKWLKFANSYKLKMGIMLTDIQDASVQTIAKTAIESAAPNVFTSNADNARLIYLKDAPNTNPVYSDLVASGRHDFVPANTLVNIMNGLVDPRREFYFTLIDTSSVKGTEKLAYVGGKYGAANDYTAYSHVADQIQEPTFEGLIFDYPEVEFLLAEAVEKGFNVGGTAQEHYNAAITASILYWGGTTGQTDVAVAAIPAYLANPKVAYNSAPGDFKQKIGLQEWIALYNQGFEAWTTWRRLDYPLLTAPEDALSGVPVRYTYPIEEQTLNGANYRSASTAIGGDDVITKLFWDKY